MSDREWNGLILDLGRYASYKSRRFYWRTGRSGELPSGEAPESIVSKALVLWLTGRRRWSTSEYPDLQAFLQGVIDSLLSHSASGYDNRNFEPRSANFEVPDDSPAATPEGELLAKERAAQADRTLAEITRQSQHDAVAVEILDAIRQGAATRRDIVAATGRPAGVIDNGLKRLRRVGASVARQMQTKNRPQP